MNRSRFSSAVLGGAALVLIIVLTAVSIMSDQRDAPVISFAAAASAPVSAVYITPSGAKFHRSDCRAIKDSALTEMTRENALLGGYEPCRLCDP